MGTGYFTVVKGPGRVADHSFPSKRQGHERVELYLFSSSGPQWTVIGRTFKPYRIFENIIVLHKMPSD
jgi:hypothetical protein